MPTMTYATVLRRKFSKRKPADTIYVDVEYSATGRTGDGLAAQIAVEIEGRKMPLINITFADGHIWCGTFGELRVLLNSKTTTND